jgi:hypothetical protein
MEEKCKTRVLFKMTPEQYTASGINLHDSECIAFLLDVPTNKGHVMSYMHVGQHGEADSEYCYIDCTPATLKQYQDLKNELESIGYDLIIGKFLSEQEILTALYKWLSDCDSDELARITEEAIGGECSTDGDIYCFVPNENYFGAFDKQNE